MMLLQVYITQIIFEWDETGTPVWNCPELLSIPDKQQLKNYISVQNVGWLSKCRKDVSGL